MPSITWDFEPSILLGIGLWVFAYRWTVGPLRRRRRWGSPIPLYREAAFHLGTLSMFVALISPLDNAADTALFSAHMAQHMILTFIAPPLWLIGTPDWLIKCLFGGRLLNLVTQPPVAFLIFNGVMWAWHLPLAYDAALQHPLLHTLEHLSFMASAVIGWWPILGPNLSGRGSAALKVAYLIPSLFSCTALAALITLSSIQLYSFYGNAALQWGLKPLADQQIGGLIMWLLGDMLYVLSIVVTVNYWLEQSNVEMRQVKS